MEKEKYWVKILKVFYYISIHLLGLLIFLLLFFPTHLQPHFVLHVFYLSIYLSIYCFSFSLVLSFPFPLSLFFFLFFYLCNIIAWIFRIIVICSLVETRSGYVHTVRKGVGRIGSTDDCREKRIKRKKEGMNEGERERQRFGCVRQRVQYIS